MATTIPGITSLPTAPARTDSPSVFITRADAFVDALENDFDGEMNASITAINIVGEEMEVLSSSAEEDALTAENAAANALSSANATVYTDVTTYDIGDTVIGSDGQAYRCLTDSTIGDDPVGSVTGDWQQVTGLQHAIDVTSSFTASSGNRYRLKHTASIIVTLPINGLGTIKLIEDTDPKDYSIEVSRNGKTIMGLAENMDITETFLGVELVGDGTNWRIS